MDSEKVHDIGICRERDCCRVHIANMNLVQFGFIPTINRLVSEVQCSISNQRFHQGLLITNIFLMGIFLFCRSQKDYKFLEDMLLMDLMKANFTCSNELRSYHQMNNIQITKVEEKSQSDGDEISGEKDQNSIANIALKGSIMYGTNPNNRLVERFATESYAIGFILEGLDGFRWNRRYNDDDLCDNLWEPPQAACNQLNSQTKILANMLIPIIKKNTALASLESIEDEINTYFTLFNCWEDVSVEIGKPANCSKRTR